MKQHKRRWRRPTHVDGSIKQNTLSCPRSGATKNKYYLRWNLMIHRCFNPNNSAFKNYGGRGITVCERWLNFYNYLLDIGEPPSENMTIDRIDNDGNYEPRNIRWATYKEQNENTRSNTIIEIDGVAKKAGEWSLISGVPQKILLQRIRRDGFKTKDQILKPTSRSRKGVKWKKNCI